MEALDRAPLIWFDMEMTGLDPATCVPLQVALVITDSELEEHDSLELTIWQPESVLATMDPFVRKMHTQNGLLDRVRASTVSVAQAERHILECVTKWCPFRTGVLAGNSIHTDRRFVIEYFPVLDGYLNYRMVDVSSIKELAMRWYGRDIQYVKNSRHTALEDVYESIAELRHYRKRILIPVP